MASRNASFHDGVLAGALLAPLRLLVGLTLAFVGILVAVWVVQWIFVCKVGPEGVARMKSILDAETNRGVELAAWQGLAPGVVTGTANALYGFVFRATGIHEMGSQFGEIVALSVPDTIVRNAYIADRDAIEGAMIGTQLLGVRVATLGLLLPLLGLIYAVAVVDGLSQRAIRRASGGRESANLYHRAKHLQVAATVTTVLMVAVWPSPVDCVLIGAPLAVTIGLLVRTQCAYYKKHF